MFLRKTNIFVQSIFFFIFSSGRIESKEEEDVKNLSEEERNNLNNKTQVAHTHKEMGVCAWALGAVGGWMGRVLTVKADREKEGEARWAKVVFFPPPPVFIFFKVETCHWLAMESHRRSRCTDSAAFILEFFFSPSFLISIESPGNWKFF